MLPKILHSNPPLSNDSRARLLKLRASQNAELDHINESIKADRASITDNEAAISSIEQAIKKSKAALISYNSNMDALRESKSRMAKLSAGQDTMDTPTGRKLPPTSQRAHALIASGASSELKYVEQQEKDLQTRIQHLKSMLCSLEQELHDAKVEMAVSVALLSVHITSMQGISSNLKILKAVVSPIKQVPPEVWGKIFHIVAAITHPASTAKIQPPLSISQVCRGWRNIATGSPHLWMRIPIAPVPWWPKSEIDMVRGLVGRARKNPITLLLSLHSERKWESQALASEKLGALYLHEDHVNTPDLVMQIRAAYGLQSESYKPTYQHGYVGTSRLDLQRVNFTGFPRQYSIHFCMGTTQAADRKVSIPLNRPQSITIESPIPRASDILGDILSPVNHLASLTLLNTWPSHPSHLTRHLANLKYLRLKFHSMESFAIDRLLPSTIEEFHVEHSTHNTFNKLRAPLTLPKLHTLSITLHEHSLCSMLILPNLRKLTIHSSVPVVDPNFSFDVSESQSQFRQMKHLCFCGWNQVSSSSFTLEVAKRIALVSTQFTELTFTRSHVNISDLTSFITSIGSRLLVINLAYCTGMTRADCESLMLIVEKLNVFI